MTINLPKNWGEVTLEQYISLHDLNEMEGSDEERVIAVLSVMSGTSIEDLREVRFYDLQRLMKGLDFLKEPIVGKVKWYFPLSWNGYRIAKNVKQLSAGQYIDLNYFLSNYKAPKNFPDIMAVLMQPTRFGFVRKKQPMEHEAIRELAKELPMTIVKPLTDFFLQDYEASEKIILEYSLTKMKQQAKELEIRIRSAEDTAG